VCVIAQLVIRGIRFTAAILPPYLRHPKSIETLLAILDLKGIATGGFSEALKDVPGLSLTSPHFGHGVWHAVRWTLDTGHWALAPGGNHQRRRVVARRIPRQAKKRSRVALRQQAILHKTRSELLERSARPILATACHHGRVQLRANVVQPSPAEHVNEPCAEAGISAGGRECRL
jgi:hypothetical protein